LNVIQLNSSPRFKSLIVGAASILLILTVAFGGYFPTSFFHDAAPNISKKENLKAKPEVKKRTIVLSTPVFRDETKSDLKEKTVALSTPNLSNKSKSEVKKRTIALSTSVAHDENTSDVKERKIVLSNPVFREE